MHYSIDLTFTCVFYQSTLNRLADENVTDMREEYNFV